VADPGIDAACGLMRDVMVRRLSRLGDLAAAVGEPAKPGIPDRTVVPT
jgi:hypothetical protein